jgi:type I restriction enzyme, S subunit
MSGMNFLERLLDGVAVEWKTLEEVASFRRGSFPQPYGKSEWYNGEGSMPFVQVVDVLDGGFALKGNTKQRISKLAQPKSVFVEEGTVIVTLQGTIGRVAVTQYDSYVDRTLAIFTNYISGINKKYFAYQLKSKFDIEKENARGSTLKTITKEEFSKFEIPIPCPENPDRSLAIQAEIVRILDTFTALTAELTAELGDRQKQYNYYRDRLLTFEKGEVEWKPLGDVATLITKGTTPKVFTDSGVNFVKLESFDNGRIDPAKFMFVSIEAHSKELKRSILQSNDILFAIAGATIGKCTVVEQSILPANTNQALAIVRLGESVNVKFVFYCMQTTAMKEYIAKYNKASAQPNLNLQQISDFRIPFPPLPEQARIVAILDKFDTLTNSISEGLPREIELRQQQYEYYRDLLLTFPKPEAVEV